MIIVDMRKERPKDISKACRLLKLSRSSLCYTSIKDDVTVMVQLENLAKQNPVEGFGNVTTASGIQGRLLTIRGCTGCIKDGPALAP
ncbi:MAG: hypothetical protein IPJ81_12945 [Chitinophagaceae bacterium]|nr:hypothetical protein [Chitinophagaceae bacterium]MBK7884579.1 hypothetical protein [Chitinophagaceae bacterium]